MMAHDLREVLRVAARRDVGPRDGGVTAHDDQSVVGAVVGDGQLADHAIADGIGLAGEKIRLDRGFRSSQRSETSEPEQ